jgi:hypothetical protein
LLQSAFADDRHRPTPLNLIQFTERIIARIHVIKYDEYSPRYHAGSSSTTIIKPAKA